MAKGFFLMLWRGSDTTLPLYAGASEEGTIHRRTTGGLERALMYCALLSGRKETEKHNQS